MRPHLTDKRSPGDDPEVKRVGLDLGMATTGAGRRSSMGFRDRIGKATRRNSNRIKLRLPSVKANVRILQGSVLAGGIWGHQAQGLSPKERKTVRMMAAATGFRQKLGSVDIVLDLGEGGLKDPHETVVLQHWRAMGKILRSEKSPDWLERTWKVLWSRLEGPHSWKRVSEPLGALVCYLKQLGVQGEQLDAWVFPKVSSRHTFPGDRGLPLPFEPRNPEDTFGIQKALARAIRAARWGRIAGQDSGSHLKEGMDWTVPRSIVKEGNLCFYRTAWQGALLTSAKGSPLCPTCKVQVDLQHILYDCTWWDSQKIALPKHASG